MNPTSSAIEVLEARIAPASVTISYADLDGDLVKITASNKTQTAPPLDGADLAFVGGGSNGQLATLTLTDAGFAGANILFTVAKKPGGNGLADVGRIDATGVALGTVTVKGDLGVIDAGTGEGEAIKSLTVRSMGLQGTATQGSGDLQSDVSGALGSLKVSTDLKDAFIKVFGGTFAKVGSVTIRGSLIGGAAPNSGSITATGGMGPLTIGRDVVGGGGEGSGGIDVVGEIASVFIRGSLIGGSGGFGFTDGGGIFHEGQIFATGNIGPVKVARNMIGGDGFASGQVRSDADIQSVMVGGSLIGGLGAAGGHICSEGNLGPVKIGRDIVGGRSIWAGWIESFGTLGNVTVGGSVLGGSASVTGLITSTGSMGTVRIGGDLIGGSINGTLPSIDSTGIIASYSARITSVTIGGSIIAGIDASSSAALGITGSITAADDIGFITVKGSLIGNVTAFGESRVTISAEGQLEPTGETDIAIGKITIGGRVEHARILGGYAFLFPSNGNAQIGPVTVGGDWRASSLVAGIQDVSADGFGNADDVVIAIPPEDATFSRIASVTIKGLVIGTAATGDHFGFTAQEIGAFKAGGIKLSLTEATDAAITLALVTQDVALREV
jgi:hypothetical protein